MSQKRKRNQMNDIQKRKVVGIIVSAILILFIVGGFVGYKLWIYYNNAPEKIAQRFIDAFSIYSSPEMAKYSTIEFWQKEGGYYENISRALGILADNIAKDKGLPKAMLKPLIKLEIPSMDRWKESETATSITFVYDGSVVVTFPESPTLSTARIPIHGYFVVKLCKISQGWRVCDFQRVRKYADWTVYEFIEARMSAYTEKLDNMLCKGADSSIKNYVNAYDVMVHDAAGDANIAWVISHIGSLKVDGEKAFVEYGLFKVSSQDPTNPVYKWKYVDVKESLTLCKQNGVWYIKSIDFIR